MQCLFLQELIIQLMSLIKHYMLLQWTKNYTLIKYLKHLNLWDMKNMQKILKKDLIFQETLYIIVEQLKKAYADYHLTTRRVVRVAEGAALEMLCTFQVPRVQIPHSTP